MVFQFDTRNYRTQEVKIGREDQEAVVFHKTNFLIQNLAGTFEGIKYQMKLAAPWNGFRYQLRQDGREAANASKSRRMHAFEPDRPLVRHNLVEFELDIHGRVYRLVPDDRFGLVFTLREGDEERGRLVQREFEAQRGEKWEGDLQAPEDWTVPLAGFVAWLVREGRRGLA